MVQVMALIMTNGQKNSHSLSPGLTIKNDLNVYLDWFDRPVLQMKQNKVSNVPSFEFGLNHLNA